MYLIHYTSLSWLFWRQRGYLTTFTTSLAHRFQPSPTLLRTKSVAHMRWADLGDHCQGIKWIKCFNPRRQDKQKKSWLTDWRAAVSKHETQTEISRDNVVALCAQVSLSEELRWVREVDLPSAADVPGHRITSFICYIIPLHNDTHTHTNTLTRQTCLGRNWVYHGCPLLQMFLLR